MMNDDENPLRRFLNQKNPKDHFPDNYKESPIYKKGRDDGFDAGVQSAWREADKVISPIRSILQLHDRSYEDHFDE